MNRLLRVLLILVYFELGVLLVFLPWSGAWERNYFLTQYPLLRTWLLDPSLRGAVTGLGVLNIAMAIGMIRRRDSGMAAPRN